jgi:hypothetical protein
MYRFKITTQYGEYNSVPFDDKEKSKMVKMAKDALTTDEHFSMRLENDITFVIGKRLLETSQFQIEHLEDNTTNE